MNGITRIAGMVLIAAALAAGCSKGGSSNGSNPGGDDPHNYYVPNDTIAPVLVVSTPTGGQVFSSGNPINVTGRITDELGLYRGSIRIVNDANGELQKEQLFEIHSVLDYNYSLSFPTYVTVVSNYTVTVWFEDHGLNKVTQTVKVKINP